MVTLIWNIYIFLHILVYKIKYFFTYFLLIKSLTIIIPAIAAQIVANQTGTNIPVESSEPNDFLIANTVVGIN